MCDIHKKDVPFGGITVVFGGDFCQTLPVIAKGVRQQIISASLCRGRLWADVEKHYLVQNMCLEVSADSEQHAAWLLQIGARNIDETQKVEIPQTMICENNTIDGLVDSTYPDLA